MDDQRPTLLQRALSRSRYLVLIAVAGLALTSLMTFGWAAAKSVQLLIDLLDGEWRSNLAIVKLLVVIDMYLIAIVQVITVIGLYELFIAELDVPQWLHVTSLNDLKKSIVDILIVFMAVKGIEGLLNKDTPLEARSFSGAVGILILVLTLFRWQCSAGKAAQA